MLSNGTDHVSSRLYATDTARYRAFEARDARAEGHFIIAVKTTEIYCRPGCPARPPKRENVEFFDTIAEAKGAGYRACLRCKPDEPAQGVRIAKVITEACRKLERDEGVPTVASLAKAAGFSEGRFHRLFKQATGL